MEPHLRTIRDHSLQRRSGSDLRCGHMGQHGRRLGPQTAARPRHFHLRHRRRCDRTGTPGRLDGPGRAALHRGVRADRCGNALPHAGRRDHADTLPHLGHQLLCCIRNCRRPACLGDIRGIAGAARLARCRNAWRRDDPRRYCDCICRAGIGALAHGQRALRRGACPGCAAPRSAARAGAAADHRSGCASQAGGSPNCTKTPHVSGRP